MAGNGASRDPVSLLWDRAAAGIMPRVYAQQGRWYATRITDPRPEHLAYFATNFEIDVTGPDNAATISGRHVNYRTRWNRSFVRAMHYYNKFHEEKPLEIQVGRPKAAAPGLPSGWAVRLRVSRSESRAQRAVRRKAERDRIWVGDKEPGGRFSDITGRDW